jgi:integrase
MFSGKAREMGLGSYPSTTLEMARAARDRFKRLRQEGRDPIATRNSERAAERLEGTKAVTFGRAALEYMALKAPQWGNEKHRKQWLSTLRQYAEPILGELPVQSLDAPLIKKVLDPIWLTKSETASRLRGRIELILDYCGSMGYRTGENPARWRGCLKDLMPSLNDVAEVQHHPSLPYSELPDFIAKLRAEHGIAPRALEWIILTATRANEALGAVPLEVNKTERLWTIPKIRMKGRKGRKREHRVPVTERAIEILDLFATGPTQFLFQGAGNKGKKLSDGALLVLLERMGYGHVTTHGFRSTFRTWAAEQTNFSPEVAERALAHVTGDETEEAYNRGELLQKRRRLMEAWAGFCDSKCKSADSNIVRIKAAVHK